MSAKPGDRSDYFKAVLEVADLDVVRTEVSALIAERDAAPRHRLLIALKDVAGVPLFAAAVDPLRQTSDLAAVEVALRAACHAAAPPTDPTGTANEPLPETVARLRQALQARQSDVLPVADLTSLLPAAPAPIEVLAADPVHQPVLQNPADRLQRAATEYGQRVAAVDAATAAVLPLLQAALRIDRVPASTTSTPVPARCA